VSSDCTEVGGRGDVKREAKGGRSWSKELEEELRENFMSSRKPDNNVAGRGIIDTACNIASK
jgi:hypothetical protein